MRNEPKPHSLGHVYQVRYSISAFATQNTTQAVLVCTLKIHRIHRLNSFGQCLLRCRINRRVRNTRLCDLQTIEGSQCNVNRSRSNNITSRVELTVFERRNSQSRCIYTQNLPKKSSKIHSFTLLLPVKKVSSNHWC